MDDNTQAPSERGDVQPPTEGTPKANVTLRKPELPQDGGPGFITLSNKSGKSMKVKVSNIHFTIAEVAESNEKVAAFVRSIEANKGTVVISKRSND